MAPAANSLLSLVIISLGLLGVTLSFLVPDRKKSTISLVIAGVIILVGAIQYFSNTRYENRWKKRVSDLRSEQQVDIEKLRADFKKKAEEARAKIDETKKK